MSAVIHLDRPHAHFTNLDFITGRVVVNLPSETAIGGIQVKLEGESRTRLSGPRYPNQENSDKRRTELEVHKVRYTALVIPNSRLTSLDPIQGGHGLPSADGVPWSGYELHLCFGDISVSV